MPTYMPDTHTKHAYQTHMPNVHNKQNVHTFTNNVTEINMNDYFNDR